jgi:hypothetical protein
VKADTTYLRALNAEYRQWTGEELYLYASQATEASRTRYTFVSGSITGLAGAEGYLRWALKVLKDGRYTHGAIIDMTPSEETQA